MTSGCAGPAPCGPRTRGRTGSRSSAQSSFSCISMTAWSCSRCIRRMTGSSPTRASPRPSQCGSRRAGGIAVAVTWAQEHVPAILEAWYPGQAGGTAIAEVLFGAYNPGGRLPVTFYWDVADLPPFEDYRMAGRTYRFFEGVPLYPFGYGLSYTTFRYDRLRVSRDTLRGDDSLTVSVDVTNTGARGGDEVVQLYVRYPHSAVPRPRRDLRGFRRVTLGPGETRPITFQLTPAAFRYWDADAHHWAVGNGPAVVGVGASSGAIRPEGGVTVVGQR